MTTPFEKAGFKATDVLRVIDIEGRTSIKLGDLVTLKCDDGSNCPFFWNEDKTDYNCIRLNRLVKHEEKPEGKTPECIITRDQYEAAVLAATTQATITMPADGWIDWAGGECPVDSSAIVDVKLQSGVIHANRLAGEYSWKHEWTYSNIISYRLHQPKKAWQAEVDDESDLNECIGQQTPWNGEGLPPVGVEIEWREGKFWYPGTITAISEQLFIIKDRHGNEDSYSRKKTDIRPVTFERDELAAVIAASVEGGYVCPQQQLAIAADLIAAGYRKQ